jgi:hypothetical protein
MRALRIMAVALFLMLLATAVVPWLGIGEVVAAPVNPELGPLICGTSSYVSETSAYTLVDTWSTMGSSTTEELNGVWSSSPSDIFAVGSAGVILHYDGSAWNSMTSNTTNNLYSIWGSSSSDVFAVGSAGTILHYNGSAWNSITSNATYGLNGVWGNSTSDIFAVGSTGTILHYDGSAWNSITSNTTYGLNGVWGSSPSDVFAVGSAGTILHYDGSAWNPMTSNTTYGLNDVWGCSQSDIFAVGDSGTIMQFDGSTWDSMKSSGPMTIGTTNPLRGVGGSSSSDVFVVGDGGTILHYNGSVLGQAWLEQPTSNTLSVQLTNISTVTFDLVRAGIAAGEDCTIDVSTDSLVNITLDGLDPNAGVVLQGVLLAAANDQGQATFDLAAGDYELAVNQATFVLSNLTISSDNIKAYSIQNHQIIVSVDVKNNSIIPGTYTAVLQLNGAQIASKDTQELDGGASQTVSFTTKLENAGTYTISVGDLSGTLKIGYHGAMLSYLIGGLEAFAVIGGAIFFGWSSRKIDKL